MYIYYPQKTLKSVLLDILRYCIFIIISGVITMFVVFTYVVDPANFHPDDLLCTVTIWFSAFILLCLLDPIQNYRSFQKQERIFREKRIREKEEQRRQEAIKWMKKKAREEANRQYELAVENGRILKEIKSIPEEERTPRDWYNLTTIIVGNTIYVSDGDTPHYQFVFEGEDLLNRPSASDMLEESKVEETDN